MLRGGGVLLAIVDSEMLIKMNRDMRSVALAEGIGINEQDRLLFKSNQSDREHRS